MPKINCLCGQIVPLFEIPNPHTYLLLWERHHDAMVSAILEAYRVAESEDEFQKRVFDVLFNKQPQMPDLYQCPHCNRLVAIGVVAGKEAEIWFGPEEVNLPSDPSLRRLFAPVSQ